MQEQEVFLIFSSMVIFAGFWIIVLGLRHRTKIVEMHHRERLAMIERGLAPPPETDPAHYSETYERRRPAVVTSRRSLSAGIVIIGFGLGLAMLIGFAAGAPGIAAGIGGAIVSLGAAFVATSLIARATVEPPSAMQPPTLPRSAVPGTGFADARNEQSTNR